MIQHIIDVVSCLFDHLYVYKCLKHYYNSLICRLLVTSLDPDCVI